MRTNLLILVAMVVVAISACGQSGPTPAQGAAHRKAVRSAAADAAIAKTPVPRHYKIDGNDLLVLDVLSKDAGSGTLESQRCFVWRDEEFKTATMTCPQQPEEIWLPDGASQSTYPGGEEFHP